MKYKKLGTTDISVSLICLGTMTWGTQNNQNEAFAQMDFAFDKGVNFFDTAELYSVPPNSESYGKTETMIGNWFKTKKKREKIILATKIAGPGCSWIRGGKNSFNEKDIKEAIDGSLKRLQTDYIDLYQLHWPERSTNYFGKREFDVDKEEKSWNDFETILIALQKFIKEGKIRYIGVSNETPYGLSKFLEISKNDEFFTSCLVDFDEPNNAYLYYRKRKENSVKLTNFKGKVVNPIFCTAMSFGANKKLITKNNHFFDILSL